MEGGAVKRNMKHTPGPWVWRGFYLMQDCRDAAGEIITNPYSTPCGYPIADDGSAGGEYNETITIDSPDARLIATAPELLEALKAARQEFDECCADTEGTPTQKHFAELLSRCNAVIAKAEGVPPANGAATADKPSRDAKTKG